MEYSSRLADNQDKLSTRFNELGRSFMRLHAWAEQDGVPLVTPEYVNKAIWEKTYRSNK